GPIQKLAPARWLEELGALLGRELERGVAALEILSPRSLAVLEQPRTAEIDQPPAERRLCVEITRQLGHLIGLEIDQQTFVHHQRLPRLQPELREQRAAFRH